MTTLREKIAKLNKDEVVCIGSRSAFFFIGYPSDFEAQVDELNESWQKNFKKTAERSKQAIQTHIKQKPKKSEVVKKKITDIYLHKTVDVEVSYDERNKEWRDKFENLKTNYEHALDVLAAWTPFYDRPVLRTYRNMDDGGTIIIVSGYEVARFWFKHEYDDFKKNKSKAFSYSVEEEPEEEDIEEDEAE